MSSTSEAEHYAHWLEVGIFYFRFQLHQTPYVLLCCESLVFYINNPAFYEQIITIAFTSVYI